MEEAERLLWQSEGKVIEAETRKVAEVVSSRF
jgi:hypothetical protein